jgi:hypothetical protein
VTKLSSVAVPMARPPLEVRTSEVAAVNIPRTAVVRTTSRQLQEQITPVVHVTLSSSVAVPMASQKPKDQILKVCQEGIHCRLSRYIIADE